MFRCTEESLLAFRDELKKLAFEFSPSAVRRLGGAGALAGIGSAVGAIGGGIHGGIKGYQGNEEEGNPGGVGGAVGGALSGIGRGALYGGGAGLVAGGLAPGVAEKVMKSRAAQNNSLGVGSLGRFGQRQMHGFTGYMPEGGLHSIHAGSYEAEKAFESARQAARSTEKEVTEPGRKLLRPWTWGNPKEVTRKLTDKEIAEQGRNLVNAHDSLQAVREAERMGLTSLPGTLGSMKNHGIGKTLGAGLKAQWEGAGKLGKGVTLAAGGLGALDVVNAAREPGEDQGERIGGSLGGMSSMLALSPVLPFGAGMMAGEGLMAGGRLAGRGIDALRKKRTAPPTDTGISAGYLGHPSESPGQVAPSEIIRTPAAAGQVPEGLGA